MRLYQTTTRIIMLITLWLRSGLWCLLIIPRHAWRSEIWKAPKEWIIEGIILEEWVIKSARESISKGLSEKGMVKNR